MSIWLELMCDVRSQGPSDYTAIENFCYTQRNENPSVKGANATNALTNDIRVLNEKARSAGWNFTAKKWACPNCYAYMRE
jgi:hypothetical protein